MTLTNSPCIFSVDVEDWFHILALPRAPEIVQWDQLPSHVERNFRQLLDVFAQHDVRTTCFFLGWVAERYPELVREAMEAGHEVASHGYSHTLTYELTPALFEDDIKRTKHILESITGKAVLGYLAPGFSATADIPWFFDSVARAGYQYDSSVFPAARLHGGMLGASLAPHRIETRYGKLMEFPISVVSVLGQAVCFFGGGYLRLFPYPLIKHMSQRVLREGRPVVYYVHPREVDPDHPRLPMGWMRNLTSYVNVMSTKHKLQRLLRDFQMMTFEEYMAANPLRTEAC